MQGRTVDQVYAILRSQIVARHRLGGDHLGEEHIARELNVSRTPVRAALQRLDADGFVRTLPNKGCVVRTWSRREISEIYEVRVLLEGRAASLAARHRSQEDFQRLVSICCEMEDLSTTAEHSSHDLEALSELNRSFHVGIISAGGNETLLNTSIRFLDIAFLINTYRTLPHIHVQRSVADHRALAEAVGVGDEAWASALMQGHILAARNRLGLRTEEK